jgi:hypothetical protein
MSRSRNTGGTISLAIMGDGAEISNIKGALVGAMISSGFGLAWSLWGASGLSGAASTVVRIAGIVVGVLIILGCAYLWRSAPAGGSGSGAMFSSGAYRLIVALEVLARDRGLGQWQRGRHARGYWADRCRHPLCRGRFDDCQSPGGHISLTADAEADRLPSDGGSPTLLEPGVDQQRDDGADD